MIVISEELYLSPDADRPLANPVIGWHNLVTVDTISVGTEEADHPGSNLANVSTNLFWRGADNLGDSPAANETIEVDTSGYSDTIDYIAVARHNWGSAQITVYVEYLSGGVWQPLAGPIIPANDAPLIFRFTPAILQGIRFRLDNGTEAPEAAVVFCGKLLVFQRGTQGEYTPLTFARVANRVAGVAEGGDFLGVIIKGSTVQSTVAFSALTPSWVRTYLDPFLEVSAEQPFFFAWWPEAYPYEVGYAWLENNAQPVFDLANYGSIELSMTGILE